MIPDIKELNFPKVDGRQYVTLTHATPKLDDMGEKNISTQVKIDGEIVPDFSFDWAVKFQGEKYIMPLRIPQGAKENTSLNSTIDLTFQHWAIYQLKRWPFVTIQQIAAGTYLADEEVAPVQLNLGDFCELFGQVLDYYYGGAITIDLNPAWQYKQEATIITISHTTVWNVLIDAFHGKYGVRWEIKASEDAWQGQNNGEKYVIRVGYPTTEVDHIFEYGFEGGLLKVERQVQSEEIRNILKGRGGDTNIPFRYFKDTDPNNKDFRPDPDWVEELANIYFPNLMPATFRSYVQGWKAAHISKYPGYTAVGEANAYAPWAYSKGATDTKFRPVEFVADQITLTPADGDRQVEIMPGYAPYVAKGSSLDRYGPLSGTLDNNDDIYPTIQGTGMDVVIDVEQIESDDVAGATENDAVVSNVGSAKTTRNIGPTAYDTLSVRGADFVVLTGQTANFIDDTRILSVTEGSGRRMGEADAAASAEMVSKTIRIYNAITGEARSASGIPAGRYYYEIEAEVHNLTTDKTLNITVGTETPRLESATVAADQWLNTFDIWVKNIWDSARLSGETDSQYAERVWKPVLGDRDKNTAKIVFTSGALAHEDYEFTIVGFPVPDSSRSYEGAQSHWRIKLAKSDAELEASGLYVPSTKRQGKAGDTIVFTGTEMTHHYVVWGEVALADWLLDQLGEKKEIKPTLIVTTDRVRLSNGGRPGALIGQLRVGNSIRVADKRFVEPTDGAPYETFYLQSITYTYREPIGDDAALNPDVEITLGSDYGSSANPISVMQGEISSLRQQIGSISNVEQIVRSLGDRRYLRKDGISERSLSPTQFLSLVTSGDFRAGLIGGAGWGIYRDENGNAVIEADRFNARQELAVNTLVINQAEGRGGMQIDTAAFMEVTRVVETNDGYVCYFDQKSGSVANLFKVGDVAFCNRWTAENAELKFYKRRIVDVGADYVTLTKGLSGAQRPADWPDSGVNGTGVPAEGDNIIHFGSYTDIARRYVKIRDVVGGGYECYLGDLDSVNAAGKEYFYTGRTDGAGPRLTIGYKDGEYAEWENGQLTIKGRISVQSTVGDKGIGDFVREQARSAQYAIDSDNEVIGIACDASGSVVGTYPSSTVSVYRGTERVTEGVTYAVVVAEGVSAAVSAAGVVTFSALTGATARVTVRADVDDVSLQTTISLYKAIPGGKVQSAQTLYSTQHTAAQPAESTFTLTAMPSVPAGMYLWSVVVTRYTDGTVTRAYAGVRQGLDYGAGKMLFNDPTFKKGSNSVNKYYYGDQDGAEVTVRRIDDATAPNDSGKVLHIASHGTLKPGTGGFSQLYLSAPNKIFVQRVIARIPEGYSIGTATVPIGTGGANYALTPMKGTGKWEEYLRKFVCGADGTFNWLGYFYLSGPAGTEDSPVEWDVAYATLFDMGANGDFQITSKSVTYAKSASGAQPADADFIYSSIGEAGIGLGDYLWTKTSVTYSDGNTVTSYSVGRVGADGTDGVGTPGADGKTSYVHWAYATSADGSENFSTTYFAGATYIGTHTGYAAADPTDYHAYEWARLRGEDARVYSLLPSVGEVRRKADGSLDPAMIDCEKRLTTGDSMAPTTDCYLYYKFVLGEENAANWVIGAGPGSSSMGATAIPTNTRYIIFELRASNSNGAAVLDRERIWVLTDASGLEVGGTNMLRNSDFIDGLTHWNANFPEDSSALSVLARDTAPGWLDGRATVHVRYLSGTDGWRSLWQSLRAGAVRAGEPYVLSGWVYVPKLSALNKTVYAKIRRTLKDGTSYGAEVIDLRGVEEGKWCYVSGVWNAPADLDEAVSVWILFQTEEHAEFYLNGWKFERGNIATAWSASPEDMSALRTALRESTDIDGGLIATTMIKLGYTEEDGEYRVTAGMNGAIAGGTDAIAFWSGGPMVDAEREPDAEEAATYVIRHSGEAYACGNTVRFRTSRIEVGRPGADKNVVLDDDGLKLIDGAEERLRVVHQSVGSLADAASNQTITGPSGSYSIDLRLVGSGSGTGGIQQRKSYQISRGFQTAAFAVGTGTLDAGAAIKMTASVGFVFDAHAATGTPGIYDVYPLSGTLRVRIYRVSDNATLCSRTSAIGTSDGINHSATLSLNETVKSAGVYRAVISVEGSTTASGTTAGTAAVTVGATGNVQLGYADQTIMGSDGFMTKWGNAALLARAGEIHAKVGTTEFLVLENGIKAIVNGKETWLAQ